MIIDGKAIAHQIKEEIKTAISQLQDRKPCLAVILVGDSAPSQIYVTSKTQACAYVGIDSVKRYLPQTVKEEDLLNEIKLFNEDPNIDGILIQLPLPAHINPFKVTLSIDPSKDVDGFHPFNMGMLLMGEQGGLCPCTPLGIRILLERLGVDLNGMHAVVIGRSNIVGKPMAALLMQSSPTGNATVTVAHRQTRHLKELCLMADLLIVAVGKPFFVTQDMVKEGAIVIDVGINRIPNLNKAKGYEIVGDVDFEKVKDKCAFITPVPGGVGPLTIAMLLSNTLKSHQNRHFLC